MAALMAVLTACGGGSAGDGAAPPPRLAVTPSPAAAAATFLDRYVMEDGRVIRHDQGGDIVSEGQAYGMLLAEIAGRPETARTIWRWTAAHLARSDGLLSWHASGAGTVMDPQSASDADILAAYALLLYAGPGPDELHSAGRRLAGAVLNGETTSLPDGSPVVVAGPWAKSASPAVTDPSYWMPSTYAALARLTGDSRWSQASGAAVRLLSEVTGGGRTLPPDSATLTASGSAAPAAGPGGSAPVQYGLDAQRVPVWLAAGCTGAERSLAARWWALLQTPTAGSAIALSLSGTVVNGATNPLPLIAAAATASAAADPVSARRLLSKAAVTALQGPTYYGDAWLGLGGALLDGSLALCNQ